MSIGQLGTLLVKTLHDTSLALLTFKDWPFYLLRNNNDVVIQRKFYITLILYVCIFVRGYKCCITVYSLYSHIIMWWCLHLISYHNYWVFYSNV